MLNIRQQRFCLEYAKHGNATQAYQAAFGTTNEKTAGVQASRLLKKPSVQERLKEIQDEIASVKIADVREVQEKLTAIIRDKVTEEVILQNGERVQRRVAVRDILKAIEILARIQGLFFERQEVKFTNAPIVISGGDCLED